jgi:hypothetical protein
MSKELGFNVELPLPFEAAVPRVREALLSTVVLQGAPELSSVARDARERMVRVAESLAKVDAQRLRVCLRRRRS